MLKKYWFIVLVILVFACNSQKQIVKITKPILIDTLNIDSSTLIPKYYITQLNDTLYTLNEEVEIEISRVLKDTVSIIGVGDIMMGTNFPEEKYLPGNNAKHLWTRVKDILRQADVTFGNLEGVILDEGGEQKKCNNPKLCYLFRSPKSYISNLVEAGFDVVSLANNHVGDFGATGRKSTMNTLDSMDINYAGLLTRPITTFKRNGMKYGMVAFAPNIGTVNIHDVVKAKKLVTHLDSISNIVIVSFHGGAEGKNHEHVTRKAEIFYGENRGNVYKFAHQMINSGADVIFGHGPHVTRAIELYKKRFIIYSLGNFCTYGRFNLSGVNGIAPIIKIYTNAEGEFLKGKIIPIKQIGAGIPKIDSSKAVISKIQSLTKKDFPESKLKIDDLGFINYIDD